MKTATKTQSHAAARKSGQAAVSLPSTNTPFDICRDALKVRWSFSQFWGDVKSNEVAEDSAKARGADAASIKGRIHLLKPDDTKKIRAIVQQAHRFIECMTLPWEEGGWRLLKSSDYSKVQQTYQELFRQYFDEVETLLGRYDELKAGCLQRLQSLENGRFPTATDMREKFNFRMFEDVLVKTTDIRLSGMSPAETEALKTHIEQRVKEQYTEAQKSSIEKIVKAVQELHDRMTEMQQPKAKGKKETSFKQDRDTKKYPIFDNVEQMLAVAEYLNFAKDPKLAAMIENTRKQMSEFNPEQVKTSKLAQEKVIATTKSVLDELAAF